MQQSVSAISKLSSAEDPEPAAELEAPSCRREEGCGLEQHDLLICFHLDPNPSPGHA